MLVNLLTKIIAAIFDFYGNGDWGEIEICAGGGGGGGGGVAATVKRKERDEGGAIKITLLAFTSPSTPTVHSDSESNTAVLIKDRELLNDNKP